MSEAFSPADQAATAEAADVPYPQFRDGLPVGRFRVIVNPEKARKYIKYRLLVTFLILPLIGVGAALALIGHGWAGLVLVLAGMGGQRLVHVKAPSILLHLALHDARIYREALDYEILEVRLAR